MSLHGLRRQAAFALFAVMGLASSTASVAQQSSRSVDDVGSSGGSGFMVIEDAYRPTAASLPASNPMAVASAANAPLGASPSAAGQALVTTASGKPIKPGDAVYELPHVKPAPVSGVQGGMSAAKPVTPWATTMAASGGAKEVPVAAPSPPLKPWIGIAPTDAKTMLIAWAKKAGWVAIWDAQFTFPVPSDVAYGGTFDEAVIAHYSVYMDRQRTKTPVCIDLHKVNRTAHVYKPDDSGKCDEAQSAVPSDTATAAVADKKVSP